MGNSVNGVTFGRYLWLVLWSGTILASGGTSHAQEAPANSMSPSGSCQPTFQNQPAEEDGAWKSGDALPRLTPEEVEQIALRFSGVKWTPGPKNLSAPLSPDCEQRIDSADNSRRQRYEAGHTYPGVPYLWGSHDTPTQFCDNLKRGVSILDRPLKKNASGHGCAAGIDCSGFVLACWGIRGYHHNLNVGSISTRTLPTGRLFRPITLAEIQKGDAVAYGNQHIRLILSRGGSDTIGQQNNGYTVCEAPGASYPVRCLTLQSFKLRQLPDYAFVRFQGLNRGQAEVITPTDAEMAAVPPTTEQHVVRRRNDTASADVEAANKTLEVTPATIAFGTVQNGAVKTQSIAIRNPATTARSVSVAIEGTSDFSLAPEQYAIPATSSISLDVTFNPKGTDPAPRRTELTVRDLRDGALLHSVALTGNVIYPCLEVLGGPTVSFGSVQAGMRVHRTVAARNCGSIALWVTDPRTESGASAYAVEQHHAFFLDIHQAMDLEIVFEPDHYATFADHLLLTAHAKGPPETLLEEQKAEVFLTGNGTVPCLSKPTTKTLDRVVSSVEGYFFDIPLRACGGQDVSRVETSVTAAVSNAYTVVSAPTVVKHDAENEVIRMRFAPTVVGRIEAQLTVSAEGVPTITVPLSGTAEPCLDFGPSALSFGQLPIDAGKPAKKEIKIKNCGTIPFKLHHVGLSGPGKSSFAIKQVMSDLKVAAANGVSMYRVTFRPRAEGSLEATIVLGYDDDGRNRTIKLTAVGLYQAWWHRAIGKLLRLLGR